KPHRPSRGSRNAAIATRRARASRGPRAGSSRADPAHRARMNWITVAWPMIAATCFTLSALHLMIGFKRHDKQAHLLYATFAAGVACFALLELQMTQAVTVDEFGFLQRWIH